MPSAQDVGRLFARGLPVATRITPQVAGGAFRQVLEIAIDGTAKLPGAKAHASRQFQRHGGATDPAIEASISVMKVSCQPRKAPTIASILTSPMPSPSSPRMR